MKAVTWILIKRRLYHAFVIAVMVIVAMWVLFPLYWATVTSFKKPIDCMTASFIPFIQFQPVLDNWISEFSLRLPEISNGLKNSTIVSLFSAIFTIVIGAPAGYALARFNYKRLSNQDIALYILGQRVLPPIVILIPLFFAFKTLRLLDTHLALILVYTAFQLPFGVIMMMNSFREIPVQIEESAEIDGCSKISCFLRISLPLVAPTLAAVALISFAFSWNDFMVALTLTYQNASTMPVVIGSVENSQGVQFWFASTRGLITILPPVLISLVISKYIVKGLTFGAVKG